MDKDRTELVDLSGKFASRAQEMAASWERWFKAASGGKFKLIVFGHFVVLNHPTHLRLNRLEALGYRLMDQNRSNSALPIMNNQHTARQPTHLSYKQES